MIGVTKMLDDAHIFFPSTSSTFATVSRSRANSAANMADAEALTNEQVAEMRKKRTFRKFTFRGVDLDKLLDLSMEVSRLDAYIINALDFFFSLPARWCVHDLVFHALIHIFRQWEISNTYSSKKLINVLCWTVGAIGAVSKEK